MSTALLCHEMKWTYQEYDSQPYWFILTLVSMLNEKGIAAEWKAKTTKAS